MAFNMNKQRGAHLAGKSVDEYMHDESDKASPAGDVKQESGQHHPPQIHIHSHDKGHTVHIMHSSGQHEKHEHEHGDTDGISQHIQTHLGQDHGGSSDEGEHDEFGGPIGAV